jgi:hypothetical protein
MNCGSPQDLKACEECGGINRKNMAVCQMCSAPFPENSKAVLPPPNAEYAAEAEALAKETHKLKRLLAELEKDVDRQLAPVKATTSDLMQTQVDLRPVEIVPPGQIPKTPPTYAVLPGRGYANRQTVIIVIVCFFVALVVYFTMTGRRPEIATVKPAASASIPEPALIHFGLLIEPWRRCRPRPHHLHQKMLTMPNSFYA